MIQIKYTVEHRGNCLLIGGVVPLRDLPKLLKLVDDDAVVCPDTARTLGVNFAFGFRSDLDALRAAGLPAELARQQLSNPSLSAAAVNWLASGSRGTSSETIFSVLTGVNCLGDSFKSHPCDPDDLDRCLALLVAVPELRPEMHLMSGVSLNWQRLTTHWDAIENSHIDEVGLGWTKSRSAPKTYALMRRVLEGGAP